MGSPDKPRRIKYVIDNGGEVRLEKNAPDAIDMSVAREESINKSTNGGCGSKGAKYVSYDPYAPLPPSVYEKKRKKK